ncbi:peptidase domain-containing ABC transporter [Tistrella mobilis]|uniref:peptidase domain-containing ABC transporter n=1 Tax=Tistrella mobilis TaxID=171437 RepID=UPI003558AE6B
MMDHRSPGILPLGILTFRKQLPTILQSEASECGLACIAMIAGYHGRRIDLRSARTYYQTSQHGSTLRDLIGIASRFGLSARAIRAGLDELSQLRLPCVLHWKFNHFVVLKAVSRRHLDIVDPARGRVRVSMDEASKAFTGIALELQTNQDFERKVEQRTLTLSSMFRSIGGLPRTLVQIFCASLAVELITVLVPVAAQFFIDVTLQTRDADLISLVCSVLIFLLVVRFSLGFARSWLAMMARAEINIAWSAGLFSRMIDLPAGFFERRHVGDVASRFLSLQAIQDAFTSDVVNALLDSILLVLTMIVLMLYSPGLAALVLLAAAAYPVARLMSYERARRATVEAISEEAVQHSHFLETVRGIVNVKLFGIADRRRSAWLNHVVDEINAKMTAFRIDLVSQCFGTLLTGGIVVLVLWSGARQVMAGDMTTGMLFAVIIFAEIVLSRTVRLVDAIFQLALLGLHTDRIAEIALEPRERHLTGVGQITRQPERKDQGNGPPAADRAAAIRVRSVAFRYGEAARPVLSGLSFDVAPGEAVAITGPSGCGKSTLLRIMTGLIMPERGVVEVDGDDIRRIGLGAYRESIACVLQNGQLFAGSLFDNISMFDPEADPEWVKACARMAAIDREIEDLPMRYDTMVGDMGSVLSGGQVQRVAIARALYRRPRILFLDEATSDLDEANETKINQAIRGLDMTRVFIAHRPSTIRIADRVIALETFQP